MKNVCKRFIGVVVLLGALAGVNARAAVSVYGEDIPSAVATNGATNPSVTEGGSSSSTRHPPVRIDASGVHIGGANPVDIDAPPPTRHQLRDSINPQGMLAIIGSFGMPVMIIAVVFYFKHRRNKMAHETLLAMIEKGVPMTPELVAQVRGDGCGGAGMERTRNRLLPGLILTGIGAALLINGTNGERRGGWVLVFIGVAFLIVWLTERNSSDNNQLRR